MLHVTDGGGGWAGIPPSPRLYADTSVFMYISCTYSWFMSCVFHYIYIVEAGSPRLLLPVRDIPGKLREGEGGVAC